MTAILVPRGLPRQTEVALKSVQLAVQRLQSVPAPADASMQQIAALQAQVQALAQRVASLQSAAGTTAPVTAVAPDSFAGTLGGAAVAVGLAPAASDDFMQANAAGDYAVVDASGLYFGRVD